MSIDNTEVNLEFHRGDTKCFRLTFKDSTGAKLPITGWKIYSSIKKNRDKDSDANALMYKVEDPTNPSDGIHYYYFTHEDTIGISPAKGLGYDIRALHSDGITVYTCMWGKLDLYPETTRII